MRRTLINAALAAGLVWAVAPQARADQSQNNPECLGTDCGAPKEEGGGGGCSCSCGCSVWVSYTDQGKTLSYTDDSDGDGIPDYADNCWLVANPDQLDTDKDGIGDKCDNCPTLSNPDQRDTNGNGIGDVCDVDLDGDGIPDKHADLSPMTAAEIAMRLGDNCPSIPNGKQVITCVANVPNCAKIATIGDACNPDIDGDGVPNAVDNCPLFANADQSVKPTDPTVFATDCTGIDTDGDGVPDFRDNCPTIKNPDQLDTNHNGIGDACDPDIDGDGVADKHADLTAFTVAEIAAGKMDNCPTVPNHDQLDSTNSGIGDACRTSYCFVVDRAQPSACLDPKAAFQVNAGVEHQLATGESLIPPLWANRKGEAISYTWTVKSAPAGSSAAIQNAKGAVTVSHLWAYQYVAGQEPTFIPDTAGTYDLQLQANLVYPDRAYPNVSSSVADLTLTVTGSKVTPANPTGASTGCTTATGLAPLLGLAVGLGLLIRRRRS